MSAITQNMYKVSSWTGFLCARVCVYVQMLIYVFVQGLLLLYITVLYITALTSNHRTNYCVVTNHFKQCLGIVIFVGFCKTQF